jgi:DsbC/DsbD-like thiol-disulfide interchange protein/cytochrome c biogenesis protein CcdA
MLRAAVVAESFLHSCWSLLLGLLWALWVPSSLANVVRTDHVTAELVAERSAVQPGGSLQIGLRLQHIPKWHTYWRNPGDSGLPTTIAWQLPAGASVGEIEWPAPKRLPIGPLVNYGYEGELLLPMRFTAPADARPGSDLRLRTKADWLVCHDVCIPESATLELLLPVVAADTTPGTTAWTAPFERAAAQRALPLQGWTAALQRHGRELLLTLESDAPRAAGAPLPAMELFPFTEQVIEPARHELYATPRGYALKLRLQADAAAPAELQGIVVAQGGGAPWGGAGTMAEFSAPLREVPRLVLPDGARRFDGPAPAGAAGGIGVGWGMALLMAFVGGMVLNLMPCVFPVLSIKLLGLAQHARGPAALRAHALAYGGGVLASFLALALALIALQAAGSAVGWGFQLQEPGVVFMLALLFFVIGLNLMGAFEFANLMPQGAAAWRAKHPGGDAFACGVLAVVAASPCTAPLMGAALGYALTQPPAVSLSVFGALGVGMALPYIVLTVAPGWRRRLPRPGAWMQWLKQGLAFPMFATAVWLLWVLGQQAGVGAMARVLMALVGLALLLWLAHIGGLRSLVGKGVGALALASLLAWSWPAETAATDRAAGIAQAAEDGWLPYDEAQLARFAAEGRPVFVDFTAAWCVSCQVNKRLVLNTATMRQQFERANVALMRADWTRRDAVITQALARLGRNGVPVYVLWRPGMEPLLLPEILSAGIVREALSTLQP